MTLVASNRAELAELRNKSSPMLTAGRLRS